MQHLGAILACGYAVINPRISRGSSALSSTIKALWQPRDQAPNVPWHQKENTQESPHSTMLLSDA